MHFPHSLTHSLKRVLITSVIQTQVKASSGHTEDFALTSNTRAGRKRSLCIRPTAFSYGPTVRLSPLAMTRIPANPPRQGVLVRPNSSGAWPVHSGAVGAISPYLILAESLPTVPVNRRGTDYYRNCLASWQFGPEGTSVLRLGLSSHSSSHNCRI